MHPAITLGAFAVQGLDDDAPDLRSEEYAVHVIGVSNMESALAGDR